MIGECLRKGFCWLMGLVLIIALDILAVDPKHHFRGAGRMLVDWGTKKADEMNVEVSDMYLVSYQALFLTLTVLFRLLLKPLFTAVIFMRRVAFASLDM